MGGWSSKPRQGMRTNLSVPNPLGFFFLFPLWKAGILIREKLHAAPHFEGHPDVGNKRYSMGGRSSKPRQGRGTSLCVHNHGGLFTDPQAHPPF
uniref:Large S protein n=1 Tax=Hepatitis B virus TaxID=10407 RepID=D2X418_HBV|nr:large S protein [Hepatitis B virus]